MARWTSAVQQRVKDCLVLAENWPALELFLLGATQWRHAGMSAIPTGLDYHGLREAAIMAGVQVTPPAFAGLRIMEDEALVVFAEMRREAGHG